MTEFGEHLKQVGTQIDNKLGALYQLGEPDVGNFERDILGPRPNLDSITMVEKIGEGLRLLAQAASPFGLRLPNGEVLKIDVSTTHESSNEATSGDAVVGTQWQGGDPVGSEIWERYFD